jgi:hypothetical protein
VFQPVPGSLEKLSPLQVANEQTSHTRPMQPSHCQRGFAHEGGKNNEAERPNPRYLGRSRLYAGPGKTSSSVDMVRFILRGLKNSREGRGFLVHAVRCASSCRKSGRRVRHDRNCVMIEQSDFTRAEPIQYPISGKFSRRSVLPHSDRNRNAQ